MRGPNMLFLSLQIAGLRFVFLINLELISLIKAEAAKMTQQWMSTTKHKNRQKEHAGRWMDQSVILQRERA